MMRPPSKNRTRAAKSWAKLISWGTSSMGMSVSRARRWGSIGAGGRPVGADLLAKAGPGGEAEGIGQPADGQLGEEGRGDRVGRRAGRLQGERRGHHRPLFLPHRKVRRPCVSLIGY